MSTVKTRARKSAKGRLKQAIKSNILIKDSLRNLELGFNGQIMQDLRDDTENLIQCIHEYNAYRNISESEDI